MEQIIKNLLVADNDMIQQATAELKEAFKKAETIPQLCQICVSSPDTQVRQYAAMLLKKHLCKLRAWREVPVETQALIKKGMLEAIVNESEKSVRNAITAFVGVLVKHEAEKEDGWMHEVLTFMFESTKSSDPKLSELGSSVFATLTDVAPDQFMPHIEMVCQLFSGALVATEATGNMATPVIYNILLGMSHLVPFIPGRQEVEQTYQDSIPYVLKALAAFAEQDSFKFIEAFDILESLADESSRTLTPHLKLLVDFCLQLGGNAQLDDSIRVKTITFVGWLVRLKKKMIIKQKLVEPIILALFALMSTAPDVEDEDEEYFGSNEVSTPSTCATQSLDVLALHIPPKQLIPPLMALLEPALGGSDPLAKKAAYLSIAVIAEGCSEHICNKYLRVLLDVIKRGITDPNVMIRNAALFALGQFSEHLQPEISQHAEEILPILFEFLQQLCLQIRSGGKEPQHIDRVFYALETFCENLENQLTPHLPVLMERLFESLDSRNTVHLRELSLTAIAATANAAKTHMLPYFPRLIDCLKVYLVKSEDEDIRTLRPQAIDTFAALVRTIGKDNFLPLAVDTLNLGLTMLDESDDPDLRRSCYNLFASMASSVGEDMQGSLSKIVQVMLDSVRSTKGVVPTFKDGAGDDLPNLMNESGTNGVDDGDDDDKEYDIENSIEGDDDDEEEDLAGYSIENAYMDEKEEAILALMEFAEHTGSAFAPFIQTAFEDIYKLLNYPNENIRKASIDAVKQFVVALHQLGNAEGVKQTVLILIPKLSEIIRTDEERTVVMSALDGYTDILQEVGADTFVADGQKDAIFSCIVDVLNGKVACQFDEPVDEEQEESEYDEAILESAGDILPKFGRALPPEEFAIYFGRVWPYFIQKIEKSKQKDEATDSQRAFAIGVLAECFEGLKEYTRNWIETLLPIFLSCVQDRNNDVRSNTVYGLGEMVMHGKECTFGHYPQIMAALSQLVSKEQHAGTLDNLCGALARLITTNCSLVPLKSVLPVFVQYLPLREDFTENLAVFRCLDLLYKQGDENLVPLMSRVLVIGLQVLYKKEYQDDECNKLVLNLVKQMGKDFPDKFNEVIRGDAELAAFVQTIVLQ
ncbi:importin-4-like [Anopheles ziemanni]|uniref:importin-4-like n=1 Tax=Anopheles coustani TaxID=139045 RepID=UPI00265A0215|nr:importin-4-like [Anopheles coustani]XP_058123823.1 importin-4-like [Anopheles coustani]XP_058123824.1 importin-4-like [Anopheles coustani]XP_058167944.1 importin-4-like [Anopheles ziemanni]XP_058167945.1 importin-4-like [Anopheles ziemanni]